MDERRWTALGWNDQKPTSKSGNEDDIKNLSSSRLVKPFSFDILKETKGGDHKAREGPKRHVVNLVG